MHVVWFAFWGCYFLWFLESISDETPQVSLVKCLLSIICAWISWFVLVMLLLEIDDYRAKRGGRPLFSEMR